MEATVTRLKAALRAIDIAEIPIELRPTAFDSAFRALGAAATTGDLGIVENSSGRGLTPQAGPLQKKASQFGIEPESLLELFTESDGDLVLTVPSNILPSEKKSRVQSLALIVTFLRQGAGMEEFTAQDVISAVTDDYGCRDSNFSTHMKNMGGLLQMKNEGGKRYFRLKRAGWEQAAIEIKRLSS